MSLNEFLWTLGGTTFVLWLLWLLIEDEDCG